MKSILSKFVSYLLCFTLCFSLCLPVTAVGESNTLGVAFSVSLDQTAIESGAAEQTVVMTLSASAPIVLDGIGFYVTMDSPLVFSNITSCIEKLPITAANVTYSTGMVGSKTTDAENAENVTDLAEITFTIPANTTAGSYSVGIKDLELTKDYGTIWESGASASTTLTITNANAGAGSYTAGLSVDQTEATVGETVYVKVSANTDFAAAELSLTYPSALFTFDEGKSTLNEAKVTDGNGTISLADYGETQREYSLAFTAAAKGTATFSLVSAAFSAAADAASNDLTPARITVPGASVQVKNQPHNVTLNALFAGPGSVEDGADYTFSAADSASAYYNYTVSASMGGQPAGVINNGDGTYTVKNVTGALEIDGSRMAKTYQITFSTGSGVTGLPTDATVPYGTDYSFNLPTREHYSISITSIKYASGTAVEYTLENGKVTILGTAITDNINVVIDQLQADAVVTVEGNAAADAAGYVPYAKPGVAYTLTVNEDALYQYTVTAAVNGKAVTLTGGNGSYTIAANDVAAGAVTFTVNKVLKTAQITATQYLALDGTAIWLIQNPTTQLQGKVYQFRNVSMYWSAEYSAYCTLVVSAEKPDISADDFKLIDGTAASVDYTAMDVNASGALDANDAQFVYNMYKSTYNGITDEVTVEKYLRADVNGDAVINTEDAAAIMAKILGN